MGQETRAARKTMSTSSAEGPHPTTTNPTKTPHKKQNTAKKKPPARPKFPSGTGHSRRDLEKGGGIGEEGT